MNIRTIAAGTVVALVSVGVLAGCSSDGGDEASPAASDTATAATAAPVESATSETSEPVESPSPAESETTEAPVSEIQAAVQDVVTALDELGIKHSEPVRTEVGLSGAKANFDITINGYDAGILVFPDADTLAEWQDLSDQFGGIHVAWGNNALSLNSSDGIANSAEIAPQIADELGGEARGV
ncbi:hypothetical protein [Demequina phytophila]|uniref:hypothetical protein n=1 Tax=Demequina phytophila TaxID=1638981 RepID=UPI0007820D72|nr:hypothetical protein [Demequina phytophila]